MRDSTGSIGEAATFVGEVLSGSLATGLATLAFAAVGLAMLTGRLEVRRGFAAILGCFLMIWAPAIARGVLGFWPAPPTARQKLVAMPVPAARNLEAKKAQETADPYAGASLIQ